MRVTFVTQLLLLTGVVLAIAFGGYWFLNARSQMVLKDHELNDLRDDARVSAQILEKMVAKLREDVLTLAGHRATTEMLLHWETSVPKQRRTCEQNLSDVFEEFQSRSADDQSQEPDYFQIRLLVPDQDEDTWQSATTEEKQWRELVRVQETSKQPAVGDASVSSDSSNFGSKGKSPKEYPYLQDYDEYAAHRILGPKQSPVVHLSEIELNRENVGGDSSQTEVNPNRPVLRAGAPVYVPAENGMERFAGIVIINMDLHNVLDDWMPTRQLTYLIDHKGRFLVHPDVDREFTFDKQELSGWKEKPSVEYRLDELVAESLGADDTGTPDKETLVESGMFPEIAVSADGGNGKEVLLRTKFGQERLGADALDRRGILWDDEPYDLGKHAEVNREPIHLAKLEINDLEGWSTKTAKKVDALLSDLRAPPDSRSKESKLSKDAYFPNLVTSHHVSVDAKYLLLMGPKKEVRAARDILDAEYQDWFRIAYDIPLKSFALHYRRIVLDPNNPERFVGMLMAISHEELDAELANRWTIWITSGVLLLGLLVSGLIAALIARPVQQLEVATREIRQGNYDVQPPDPSYFEATEVSRLSESFQAMTHAVREREVRAEQYRNRVQTMLDTAMICVVSIGSDGTVLEFNQLAEKIWGYTEQQVKGQHFKMLFPSPFRERFCRLVEGLNSATESLLVGRVIRAKALCADGRKIPVEMATSFCVVEDQLLITAFISDITERIQRRDDLDAIVSVRTAKLRHQTEELQRVSSELQAAVREKTNGLYTISHDLKQPLTGMSGAFEVLKQFQDQFEPEVRQRIGSLKLDYDRICGINAILQDAARCSRGKIALDICRFEPSGMIAAALSGLEPLIAEKNLTVEHDLGTAPPFLLGDRKRCVEIMANLVSNACKYNRGGGRITIRIDMPGDCARISVADTGVGIAEENLHQVFGMFYREKGADKHAKGMGMGLALAKSLVDLHGGEIGIDSRLGEGTTVWFTLPQSPDDAPENLPHDWNGDLSFDDVRIVAVDSWKQSADEICRVAARLGCAGDAFTSAEDALACCVQQQPDLVMSGIQLSDVNIDEFVRELRSKPLTAGIPVVLVTGLPDDGALQQSEQAGCYGYLNVKVTEQSLADTIQSALAKNLGTGGMLT